MSMLLVFREIRRGYKTHYNYSGNTRNTQQHLFVYLQKEVSSSWIEHLKSKARAPFSDSGQTIGGG